MIFELKIGRKIGKAISLYRSPSQSKDEFKTFTRKLEPTLDKTFNNNPFIVITLGDFNAKSDQWYENGNRTLPLKLGLNKL